MNIILELQEHELNLSDTKYLLSKYNIRPTKSLGQNFLVDEKWQQFIVDELAPQHGDYIIEVGPGTGVLTDKIAPKCARLTAIEIDRHMLDALREALESYSNADIVHEDALKTDFRVLIDSAITTYSEIDTIKIVSNLPYYITSPLIMKFISEVPECKCMVFTLQKEAADRILSPHDNGEYGTLSVLIQYLYDCMITGVIPATAFLPAPSVDSVVMTMVRKQEITLTAKEIKDFARFIKAAFGQRRKTLANSLSGSYNIQGGKEAIYSALEALEIKREVRPQELTSTDFRALYLALRS